MFTTHSLTIDIVQRSVIPACLSTVGLYDSSYVTTNESYLKLIERVWAEIEHKNLVSDGSAVSNPQRDRRLWLLDTQGFYDAEPAQIRIATGRFVTVEISAQRVWCSGTACDLEFFSPLSVPEREPPVIRVGDAAKKAEFSGRLRQSVPAMNTLDREILMRRMLSLTAEGTLLAARLCDSADVRASLQMIVDRLASFQVENEMIATKVSFDFNRIGSDSVEDILLHVAGEIWSLIVNCSSIETADMLKNLVAGYSVPKLSVIRS